MIIYPKISNQAFGEQMRERIKKSEGIEIQFFHEGDIASPFDFETQIRQKKQEFPNLKCIVIHPPLSSYNFELIMFKDESMVKNQINRIKELSEELDIDICMLYHTYWTKEQWRASGLAKKLMDLLKTIENTRITILIENLYMILDEKDKCSALEICKYIDHPHLKCCIDTTHVHCKANIYKWDFDYVVKNELNKEDCVKYVKQIHFAATLKNDGYRENKTHGRMHRNYRDLVKEYKWLKELGLDDKIFVTEVAEDDYYSRKDQLKEIEMLERINRR